MNAKVALLILGLTCDDPQSVGGFFQSVSERGNENGSESRPNFSMRKDQKTFLKDGMDYLVFGAILAAAMLCGLAYVYVDGRNRPDGDGNRRNRALTEALASRNPSQVRISEVTESWYRAQPTDDVIHIMNPPARIVLPSGFQRGKVITIKDRSGQSADRPIKITAESGPINTIPEFEISSNYGWVSFLWDGKEWNMH